MRIFITGNAGAGKSTVARLVAERKGLEYSSLDSIVWQERWRKTPPDEVKQKVGELIKQDAWVIDGVGYDVLRAADTVIFLDMPRRTCSYRAAKRNIRYLFSSRPELPPRCPEILILPMLIKIIWRFPKRVRPRILADKDRRQDGSFIHIGNNRKLRAYIDSL